MTMFLPTFFVAVFIIGGAMSTCDDNEDCWERWPFPPPIKPCSDQLQCKCSNVTVDCSFSNLQFVPLLPHQLNYVKLNFSHNSLSRILHVNFFGNASREITAIDLSHNGLVFIVEGVFRDLDRLTTLLLYSNHLVYKDLLPILSVSGLLTVKVGCSELGPISPNTFQGLNHSSLKHLDLKFNNVGLKALNLSVFQPFRNLSVLRLWHNKIYDLHAAKLPSLKVLHLDTNRLYNFPRTCSKSGESLFPNLRNLTLPQNMISCIDAPVCLPNLVYITLNFNNIRNFTTDMFSKMSFPSLEYLYIMEMEAKIFSMQPFFINNSAVKYLNFLFNYVDFTTLNDAVFDGCASVGELHLRGNNFQGVAEEKFHRLLQPMEESLLVLNLAETHLTHLSRNMFVRLKNLKQLDLFGNSLASLPNGVLDVLRGLTVLKLDGNYIQTISENTFGPGLRQSLKVIYLSNNPYQCSCGILWFQQWMRSEPSKFKYYKIQQGYRCANMDNVSIPSFVLNPQACLLGSDTAAFTIAITCVLIFFLLLFTIFFRFRWHVRLWMYEVCRSARRRGRFPRGRPRLRFDVFVSYAEEDTQWVLDELLPVLEDGWGLRLCVHQRDFMPGKHIVDNISDCVSDSERVLLVFSPDFARSEWCQFELRYCQTYVMERDDVMVLVALRETESRDMTGAMLAVLRSTTYLEWEDGPDARQAFWGRLHLALEDVSEETRAV